MLSRRLAPLFAALAPLLLGACAFHSSATHWNGLDGADGEPVFYTATTKVGFQLFVAVPFIGNLGIDGLVDDMTEDIGKRGGDRVRIVQGSTENYWYGFPPFTWILTPVVSTLTAEYRPSDEELEEKADARRPQVDRDAPIVDPNAPPR